MIQILGLTSAAAEGPVDAVVRGVRDVLRGAAQTFSTVPRLDALQLPPGCVEVLLPAVKALGFAYSEETMKRMQGGTATSCKYSLIASGDARRALLYLPREILSAYSRDHQMALVEIRELFEREFDTLYVFHSREPHGAYINLFGEWSERYKIRTCLIAESAVLDFASYPEELVKFLRRELDLELVTVSKSQPKQTQEATFDSQQPPNARDTIGKKLLDEAGDIGDVGPLQDPESQAAEPARTGPPPARPAPPQYADFSIRVSYDQGSRYHVFVECAQGEGPSILELPTPFADLQANVRGLTWVAPGTSVTSREMTPQAFVREGDAPSARELGVQLYNALFRDEVLRLLAQTEGAERGRRGVRVRLRMDIAGEGMAAVASLPWELVTPRAVDLPLVLSKKTVLVRSPDIPKPVDPLPFEPPLRILVVVSNPDDVPPLDLEEEKRRVEESWAKLQQPEGFEIDFERAVRGRLRHRLHEKDYHVIHFMGHGEFDEETGRGALVLEHENGTPDPADAEDLRVIFDPEDEPQLRLTFLNACQTGAVSERENFRAFASVATALLRSGIPAVVAMQFPIRDEAAIEFAGTFYSRVAAGQPVDAAVADGRKALWSQRHVEWAIPVLFMRSTDGLLFRHSHVQDTQTAGRASPSLVGRKLDIRAKQPKPAQALERRELIEIARVLVRLPSFKATETRKQLLQSAGIAAALERLDDALEGEASDAARTLVWELTTGELGKLLTTIHGLPELPTGSRLFVSEILGSYHFA